MASYGLTCVAVRTGVTLGSGPLSNTAGRDEQHRPEPVDNSLRGDGGASPRPE